MEDKVNKSKIYEWCEKLTINTVKVVSWIEEIKEEANDENYESIRDIIGILVDVLPDDRGTIHFLL